ncbi:MAG: WD40 repeat domain-containing protein [Planctomycetes bacterium]|nr:WD40 repeat domain-containing protein [Planctomycetota bacterium]
MTNLPPRWCCWMMLVGAVAASGCRSPYDGTVITRERVSWTGHADRIRSLCFSPDGTRLASASEDGTLKLWDTTTWKLATTIQEPRDPPPVLSVAFSPNGKFLAAARGDGTTKLYDQSGKKLLTFQATDQWVRCVAFAHDSKQVATAEDNGSVILWNPETGKAIKTLQGSDQAVWCVAFSPDGKLLASGGWERDVVRIWDVKSGKQLRTLPGVHGIARSLAFFPDGKTVATGGDFVWLHDPITGHQKALLRGHVTDSMGMAVPADGQVLVSAGGAGEVKVWDTTSGKVLTTYWGHPREELWAIALSPDGKTIVSGSAKGTLKVWDMVR